MADVVLRAARRAETEAMRRIEQAAGEAFRALGMGPVADDPPPSTVALLGFIDRGRAWVAELDGIVVGYALGDVVDGGGHVEQVSVDPRAAGRGIGRTLIDRVDAESPGPGLTLTTFADVPWNAPYYVRLGFRVLGEDELGPGLRALRATERARGLDRWPRVAMRREGRPSGDHPADDQSSGGSDSCIRPPRAASASRTTS